ncbi:Dynein heavy chain 1, axonemal [Homalodisca vitripennis]|nr:Dynein heavy chain 1, axonemal [Homalodisca vitripennis]
MAENRSSLKGLTISHNVLDRYDKCEDSDHPHLKLCNLWKIKTKMCAPRNLKMSNRRAFLSPSEQWTLFDNVVIPKKAFMPKLHMDAIKGLKRVVVEQRRREFVNIDIGNYLETNYSVSAEDMSLPTPLNVDPSSLHFLALELFDDEEFESRTEAEWLSLGEVDGVKHPVPARAFMQKRKKTSMRKPKKFSGSGSILSSSLADAKPKISLPEYVWTDVAVIEYNTSFKQYVVIPLSGESEEFEVPRFV